MELLQLKYFCDAAAGENFSKTAKKFGVPPSNISQSIKRLEKELSVKLFVRSANTVVLSEQGEKFYKQAKEALSLLENARAELCDDEFSGVIKICATVNRRIVMKTIEEFRKCYGDIDIITVHSLPDNLEEYDIIVSDNSFSEKDFKKERLLTEKMLLAVPFTSPLAKKEIIKAEDLKTQVFITRDRESSLYEHTEKICKFYGFSPRIAIQSDDPFYMRRCVELGLGIAFVPEFSWKGQFSDKIVLKQIGEFKRDTFIYINSRKYKRKSVEKFSDMLKKACNE